MGNVSPRHSKSYHDGLNHHIALSAATTTTTTPNRSSWKKQLQLINETLNIKKFSRRHAQGKMKRSRESNDENLHPRLLSSKTAQDLHDFMKNNLDRSNDELVSKNFPQKPDADSQIQFKKSFSLFSIKQPLNNTTNKELTVKTANNATNQNHEMTDEVKLKIGLNSVTNHSTRNIAHPESHFSSKENRTTEVVVQQKRRQKLDLTTVSNGTMNKRHSAFVLPTYHLPKSQSQYYHPHHQIQLSSYTRLSNNLSSSTKNVQTGEKTVTRKTIIQASTSELLRCLGEYLCSSCSHLLPMLDPIDCIVWIKSADRQLVLQGWQEQVFVNPANIVFVYLLVRETLNNVVPSATIKSVTELHAIILTCLYLAFSYMGNEITYPLKPFVTDDETRDAFWQRVVLIMGQLSSKMLAINQNPKFFTECFSELKGYNLVH